MKLNELGEWKVIENIKKHVTSASKDVLLGIGDDCASVKFSNKKDVLLTTDLMVENIHFNLKKILPAQLGWKTVAVNLSDIAAMGGDPKFVLSSIAIPSNFSMKFIDDLYKGMDKICSSYNTSIVGGDLSASTSGLVISITALGTARKGLAVNRSGAKVGDKIFVTGTLGDSSVGLEFLLNSLRYEEVSVLDNLCPQISENKNIIDKLVANHIFPLPRILEGKVLAEKHNISSMMDLSDGLASSIKEICKKSEIGANIYIEKLPVSGELKEVINMCSKDLLNYLLYGGEDYELLFTAPVNHVPSIIKGCPINMIGEIVESENGIQLIGTDGINKEISGHGFEHFN